MQEHQYSSVLFADFEAFQHGDESFRIKELCILDKASPMKPLYFLFKPPCAWNMLTREQKRTYTYEERCIHGLVWSEGHTRYCASCVWHYMKRAFPSLTDTSSYCCYVIGRQKADFLRKELPFLNIVEYDITLKELPHAPSHLICQHRAHGRDHCAMLKCYRLLLHYNSCQ